MYSHNWLMNPAHPMWIVSPLNPMNPASPLHHNNQQQTITQAPKQDIHVEKTGDGGICAFLIVLIGAAMVVAVLVATIRK